jgi:hypothetical protein
MSPPPVDIYSRSARIGGPRASDEEPFLRRLLLMPFLPSMWSRAADWPVSHVVLPLIVIVALIGVANGLYFGIDTRLKLRRAATEYASEYPGFTVSKGIATVDDDGRVHYVDGDLTVLVDPQETIPLSVINTSHYIVVRRDMIHTRDKREVKSIKTAEFQKKLGLDPLRVDANSIRTFDRRWGLWILLGAPVFFAAVNLVSEAFGVLCIGVVSALIARAIRGRELVLAFETCFRVALAAYAALVVIEVPLGALGLAPGACLGLVVWNVILSALVTWRVGRD